VKKTKHFEHKIEKLQFPKFKLDEREAGISQEVQAQTDFSASQHLFPTEYETHIIFNICGHSSPEYPHIHILQRVRVR
jgi:hypothetical protein